MCDLERVLENKNAFLIFNVLFKQFSFCSIPFLYKSFQYFWECVLCVRSFFGTVGSFLIVPFVLVKERSFPRNDAQPYVYPCCLCSLIEMKLLEETGKQLNFVLDLTNNFKIQINNFISFFKYFSLSLSITQCFFLKKNAFLQ